MHELPKAGMFVLSIGSALEQCIDCKTELIILHEAQKSPFNYLIYLSFCPWFYFLIVYSLVWKSKLHLYIIHLYASLWNQGETTAGICSIKASNLNEKSCLSRLPSQILFSNIARRTGVYKLLIRARSRARKKLWRKPEPKAKFVHCQSSESLILIRICNFYISLVYKGLKKTSRLPYFIEPVSS